MSLVSWSQSDTACEKTLLIQKHTAQIKKYTQDHEWIELDEAGDVGMSTIPALFFPIPATRRAD